jgi:hypothetical protein
MYKSTYIVKISPIGTTKWGGSVDVCHQLGSPSKVVTVDIILADCPRCLQIRLHRIKLLDGILLITVKLKY